MTEKLQGGFIEAETLVIVGLDECPVTAPDLEDPDRIDAPSDALVASIAEHGCRNPVHVRRVRYGKNDRFFLVIDGRQRVMATRKVNKRRKDDAPTLVPYLVTEGDDRDVTILNDFHRHVPVLSKAKTCQRMVDRGRPLAEIAAMFTHEGKTVGVQTVKNWLALLKLPPGEQKKIANGEKSASEGYAEGKGRKPRNGGIKRKGLTAKQIIAYADRFEGGPEDEPATETVTLAGAVFAFVATGDIDTLRAWPDVHGVIAMQPVKGKAPRVVV